MDAETLERIRTTILENGTSYPNFGEVIPQTWRDLHLEIDKLRSAGKKIIPYVEIQYINKKLPSPLTDEEVKVFMAFLHAMGYCLHFTEGELAEYVILEPKWIIDAMKVFVTCDKFGFRFWEKLKWQKMRSTGQVEESYILRQWRSRDRESFYNYQTYLLLVLEKLDILCHAKLYGQRGEDVDAKLFTVPCMVNSSAPEALQLQLKQPTINIVYTFPSVVPVAIFNRLICACLVLWPVYQGHLYSGLVVLKSGQYHFIALQMRDGKIFVSFQHTESLEKVDMYLCRVVRQFLNRTLADIVKTYKSSSSENLYTISYNREAKLRNFCETETQVILIKKTLLNIYYILYTHMNYFDWLRITEEGSVPEMRIWSILLIKSDLKRCIHLSRSLFSYMNTGS